MESVAEGAARVVLLIQCDELVDALAAAELVPRTYASLSGALRAVGSRCVGGLVVRAEALEGTVRESIRAFRRTPAASQVPSKLGEIEAPTQYLWSGAGEVPRQSVDRVQLAMPSAAFEVVPDAWRAHLDSPEKVAAAISSLAPQG